MAEFKVLDVKIVSALDGSNPALRQITGLAGIERLWVLETRRRRKLQLIAVARNRLLAPMPCGRSATGAVAHLTDRVTTSVDELRRSWI